MSWLTRLSNVFRPNDLDAEIDEELQFHIDASIRDNIAAGMSADEARRDALQRFGSRSRAREDTRDANLIAALDTTLQDLAYARRTLRRRPAFALVAILTMAIGIGANTAIFTVVRSVLLRPLPFPESHNLYALSYAVPGAPFWLYPGMYDRDFLSLREQNRTFDAVATFTSSPLTLSGAGEAMRVVAAQVTPDFFRVLQVYPARGTAFAADQDQPGRDRVVLLSDALWRSRFGSDVSLIGRTITLDGTSRTVVGILPAGFDYPSSADVWTPLIVRADPHLVLSRPVIGRLRAGVTAAQARASFDVFASNLPRDDSERVPQMMPLRDAVVGDVGYPLSIFAGAVAFVLLIACANVANLFLMRAVARRQEIATRLALGAGRRRLIRQLVTETALVSLAGGAAGIALAVIGGPALLSIVPARTLPRASEIHVDAWVLAFTLALSLLTGLAVGLVPAFQATRPDLSAALREGVGSLTRRSHALRHVLIVAEMALVLVLLVGAGLLVKSFLKLRAVDPGFQPAHVMTMTLDLPQPKYHTVEDMISFDDRLLASLSALPGASSTGAVNWLPLGEMLLRGDIQLEGGRHAPPDYAVTKAAVSPGYFRTMGIRLLGGRDFTAQDDSRAPGVLIISHAVAQSLFPDEDPLGKRLSLQSRPQARDWLTIVGIVDDVRQSGLTRRVVPAAYQPYSQVTRPFFLNRMTFAVRTAGDPAALAPLMRTALRALDRDLAPQSLASMEEVVIRTIAEPRFHTRLLGIFSMLALVLAAIGVYGVLASSVAERRREIGIRMALGADTAAVVRLMVRRILVLTGIAIVLGALGALAITRALTKLLFDVTPTDAATFGGAVVVLTIAALAAGLIPARQAAAVDPLIALRAE